MRRIVVTGMGAVTPLAADVDASWSRLTLVRAPNTMPDFVKRAGEKNRALD